MTTRTKEYILTESGNRISRQGLNLVHTQSIVLGGKTIIESHVTIRGDLKRQRQSTSTSSNSQVKGVDAAVSVGRYCLLSHHTTLSPPYKVKPKPPNSDTEKTRSGGELVDGAQSDNKQVGSTQSDNKQVVAGLDALRIDKSDPDHRQTGQDNGQGHGRFENGEKIYYPLKIGDYVHIGAHSIIEAASISSCVHIGAHVRIGNMCIIKEGSVIEDDTVVPPYTVIAPLSRVTGKPGLVVAECPEVMTDVIRDRLRQHYADVLAVK